jgi:imipenem/basic amino acid-specific outer membrane pore
MNALQFTSLALLCTSASSLSLAAEQASPGGFIEDGSLTLTSRNFFFSRDFRDPGAAQSYRREWAQGFLARYESGYTQGTVGFGVDAHAALGLRLDSGRERSGTALLPFDRNGEPADEYSYAGAALKARYGKTVLKMGDLMPTAPVFAVSSTRLFTSTARGVQLISEELPDTFIDAGYFTAIRDGSGSTNRDGAIDLVYAGTLDAPSMRYLGGRHAFSEQLSLGLYAARLEDVWNQFYAKAGFVLPLAPERSLAFDFDAYDTRSEGRRLAGQIDTLAWSFAAAYRHSAHTLTLAHQRINGDTPFDYVRMDGVNPGDSIYLANSSQYSDFNSPNESSVQLRYDLNLTAYGVPGLTLMARYVRGDIDGSGYVDADGPYGYAAAPGKEWERDLEAKYVMQGGVAKGLSVRLRHATHRGTGGDIDELRIITEYPFDIL